MTLSVQLDSRWIALPVRSTEDSGTFDSGDWAAGAVEQALADRGAVVPASVRHLYVQTYAALVDQLRARADVPGSQLGAAFALVGDADLLPVTVVEAAVHLVEPGRSLDAVVDELVVAPGDRFAEPLVEELATEHGTALRVQQLRVVGPPDSAEVQTSVVHVWRGPADDVVLTLSAWYSSPVDAELARELVDGLAASLRAA